MQLTPNYNLKKPEGTDPVDVQDFNDNADILDEEIQKKVNSNSGDISETTIKTLDTVTTTFPVPTAGEKPKAFLGKVKKFFEDTKNWMTGVCLIGSIVNNCVTNNASLPLSAAQGKVLMDLYTQLNSNFNNLNTTVSGHTTSINNLTNQSSSHFQNRGTFNQSTNIWGLYRGTYMCAGARNTYLPSNAGGYGVLNIFPADNNYVSAMYCDSNGTAFFGWCDVSTGNVKWKSL